MASSGSASSGERVEVGDGGLEAGEGGVVERLQLVHRAGEALGVALGLGRERPVGERLEVGELGGEGGHRSAPQDAAEIRTGVSPWRCWWSATWSRAVLCRWRSRISWSFSGNAVTARDSMHPLGRLEGVAVLQRVLLERHRGQLLAQALGGVLRAGRSSSVPSKMCVL